MPGQRGATIRSRVAVEDCIICVLGAIAGPLLWWMSQSWQQLPAASSVQTIEYWIALLCGIIGLALCLLWFVFLLSGIGLVIGLKTRNAWITYWAEVFTPGFLRRLIISVFGLQVALTTQAIAAPSEYETAEIDGFHHQEPFMPYVQGATTVPTDAASQSQSSANDQQPSVETPSSSPSAREPAPTTNEPLPSADTVASRPTIEPRQHSEAIVTPKPAVSSAVPEASHAAPRQTSTVEVEQQTESDQQISADQQKSRGNFVPQPPSPSPYIAAPEQSRTGEDPTVVVKIGDCLWDIAHHELGAEATLFQIDQRWRQWWDHNRILLGDDPHTLTPGTVLQSPPFTS